METDESITAAGLLLATVQRTGYQRCARNKSAVSKYEGHDGAVLISAFFT
jgi:hypothetical protein